MAYFGILLLICSVWVAMMYYGTKGIIKAFWDEKDRHK